LKEVNSIGEYKPEGFTPDILVKEDFGNMGVLGTDTERLTARAIQYITTGTKSSTGKKIIGDPFKTRIPNLNRFENEMYIEKAHPFQRI